ncbi:MAG: type III-B CRISPR module RAMP protein Cmr6 [Polyangia bacterium]
MDVLAIPKSVRDLVASAGAPSGVNPGLQLDKLSRVGHGKQEDQKRAIESVARLRGDPDLLAELSKRREAALEHAARFQAKTAGPLTLHLSRASSLENAGICLHPIYGFAYLPGSGLKGMARAYAETIWLAGQQDKAAAWQRIEQVFGWAPGSDILEKGKKKPWKPEEAIDHGKDDRASAGNIVFHDAWPTSWPKLHVDIVNNHHGKYYQGDDAPGDWEDPVPVYFLAVNKGTEFDFAVTKRRFDVDDSLLALAREWLTGALVHLGAGAKTASGYGYFKTENSTSLLPIAHSFEAKIMITSPCFLGGADNSHLDPSCALKPASLKGSLRFWWRAIHGDLGLGDLKKREGEVFGSTTTGQGLQLQVLSSDSRTVSAGQDSGKGGSPLGYLGYGPITYNKQQKKNTSNRECIGPGSSFFVRLTHRNRNDLHEAVRALWVLGALGGLGARMRRGWGSVLVEPEACQWPDSLPSLSGVKSAEDVAQRIEKGLEITVPAARRKSANLDYCELEWTAVGKNTVVEVGNEPFPDWEAALNDIGSRFQRFRHAYGQNKYGGNNKDPGPDYHLTAEVIRGDVQRFSRAPERAAFGLPYAQEYRSLKTRVEFTPNLAGSERRASPLFLKVFKLQAGQCVWVAALLPSRFLPRKSEIVAEKTKPTPKNNCGTVDGPTPVGFPGGKAGHCSRSRSTVPKDSSLVLEFMKSLRSYKHTEKPAGGGGGGGSNKGRVRHVGGRQVQQQRPTSAGLQAKQIVAVVLLEEKTKKGGWKAKHEKTDLVGPIQNSAEVPGDKKAGDQVDVLVMSVSSSGKTADFRYKQK